VSQFLSSLVVVASLLAFLSCSPPASPAPVQPTAMDQALLGTWGTKGGLQYIFTSSNTVYVVSPPQYYTYGYAASGGKGNWWFLGTTDPTYDLPFSYSVTGSSVSIQGFGTDVSGSFPFLSTSQASPGGGAPSAGSYTYSGSSSAINAVVNTLYYDAVTWGGASTAENYANPVAPNPYVGSQVDSYLGAAEIQAWGVVVLTYKGSTSTAQAYLSSMIYNLKYAYDLHSTGLVGSPDSVNYPGLTYAAMSAAIISFGLTP